MAECDCTDNEVMEFPRISDELESLGTQLRGAAAILGVIRDADEDGLPQGEERMYLFWFLSQNLESIAERLSELDHALHKRRAEFGAAQLANPQPQ